MRWQDIEAHNATRAHQHRSMEELTDALRVVNAYLREEFVRREEDRINND